MKISTDDTIEGLKKTHALEVRKAALWPNLMPHDPVVKIKLTDGDLIRLYSYSKQGGYRCVRYRVLRNPLKRLPRKKNVSSH